MQKIFMSEATGFKASPCTLGPTLSWRETRQVALQVSGLVNRHLHSLECISGVLI